MPRLRRLSGRDLIAIFERFGFTRASQRGSHIKLVHTGSHGERQVITVPNHRELDPGTLPAIVRQASRFIPQDQLRPHFYSQ